MTNHPFHCSLQNQPFKQLDFYDPGMALVTLDQHDKSFYNVSSLAFKQFDVNFFKASNYRFKNYSNIVLRSSWKAKKLTLTSNGLLSCTWSAYNLKNTKKPKGYVALQFSSVSKESNSTSLNLLNKLNLSIAQLMMIKPNNSKPELKTFNTQHHCVHRHRTIFAKNLVQRYVPKRSQHKTLSCQRFTVIRSPFVFKKSREQFFLTRKTCFVKLPMTKAQQHTYAQHLTASKFPSELQLTFVN